VSRREAGSIGKAAAKVARSGAILLGHTGQRVAAAAVDTTRAAIVSTVQSAAELTTSLLGSPPRRKAKRR
jgi:hypothetical protein